jgi:Ca2+-binding RTX toxin-like protein
MTVGINLAGGGSILAWQTPDGVFFERYDANLDPLGAPSEVASGVTSWASAKPLDNGGFTIVWDTSAGALATAQDYNASGAPIGAAYSVAAPPIAPIAYTSLAESSSIASSDNANSATAILPDDGYATASFSNASGQWLEQIQPYDAAGDSIGAAYTLQSGTASAFGDNQVAALADGGYVASYLHQSNFSSELDVERFAADGTHLATIAVAHLSFTGNFTNFPEVLSQSVAGLPDGGFVVSWTAQNNAPPQIFVQEFTASGAAVAPAQMLGAAAGSAPEIDAFPNGRYTVTWAAPTGQQSASFTEQGTALAPGNNDVVETPLADYALPLGPHDVILTSTAPQTVTGNSLGDTITSNDAGSTLIGGSGNDTLIAGHGADMLTGNGGADTFVFNVLSWNAGQITDFTPGTDKIDISALLTAAGYTGSDPVADGYVTFVADGRGGTQVYFDPHSASESWPALITTLDHVAPDGLNAANVLGDSASSSSGGNGSTGGGSSSPVDVSDATYTVPAGVTAVVLTGSAAQHVTANALGDTITSNDFGSTIIGGSGNDTLIAGHGADMLTGGGGADNFVFDAAPWNAGQITDFTLGTDKIDLSAMLSAAGYTGSDPVADGWISFASDGHGDTQLFFDAHNPSDPWPNLITTLDNLAPTGLTAANVLGSTMADTGSPSGTTSGGAVGSSVDTAAATYTAPAGVTNIVLTGSAAQTVTANALGDTITSNDFGSTIVGGSGNDTLIAGHGADMLTGGGSSDHFVFNVLPWNAGQITDFNPATDTLDLHGIFAGIGYTGGDPVADGYLTFVADGAGNTKVYVDPQGPSTTIPMLVTTLDHVAPSALHQGDYIFA